MRHNLNRRQFLARSLAVGGAVTAGPLACPSARAESAPSFGVSTFSADITPPVGHPLLGGMKGPAVKIADRLTARGIVVFGAGEPLVIASLDWCELRNDAYDRFRESLAQAAGTTRERVLVSCIHQHDAPYFDLAAQKLLDDAGLAGAMFDPRFFEQALAETAAAVKASLARREPFTHVGVGSAQVERVACNRRVELVEGKPRFNRYSSTRDPAVRDAPDGEIDPQLRTISFWNGDKATAALSAYATHPMSYYGAGEVSYDFPGIARELRQREAPGEFQVYLTGASGDVVAAKYNDGTPAGRQALARQLLLGLRDAWTATRRHPVGKIEFRLAKLDLPPPNDGPLAIEALEKTLRDAQATRAVRIQAAMGLSYRRRCDADQPIDVPAIDFGPAQFLLLPAEMFVGYQLAAQQMRPDQAIVVAGFGECAPGYIPTEKTRREGFVAEHGYCWNRPGAEEAILAAMRQALGANRP